MATTKAGETMELRPEVLAFARAMERELRANDHKGGWDLCDPAWLLKRLGEETRELRDAERAMPRRGVYAPSGPSQAPGLSDARARLLSEAADVANYALMVCDVWGALEEAPALRARGAAKGDG